MLHAPVARTTTNSETINGINHFIIKCCKTLRWGKITYEFPGNSIIKPALALFRCFTPLSDNMLCTVFRLQSLNVKWTNELEQSMALHNVLHDVNCGRFLPNCERHILLQACKSFELSFDSVNSFRRDCRRIKDFKAWWDNVLWTSSSAGIYNAV